MSSQLPTLLNPDFLASGLSRGFYEYVNKVGEARSKQEEERFVAEELSSLKSKLNHPNISSTKIKDYITRLIYCDMLGYNVEFGHIHAVKLTQSAKGLWDKRVGYLACSLFLHETHELSIMLINTLQKDLRSSNHLEVCSALTALCHVMNPDMIPAVFKFVEEKLSHPKDLVRKKAIMVFNRLFHNAPDLMTHLDDKFRQMLSNRDPGVLCAILSLFVDFVKADPSKYKDLIPVLGNILEQVLDRWLPRSYDYHGVPAPWVQLKIIEIMGLLAKDDEKISLEVCPHIVHTLKKAENGVDAAFAIIFECIRAISLLHPQALSKLVHKSLPLNPLSVITRFLKSHNHNLKYLGLIALSEVDTVWWVEGQWWGEEQMNVIVECLEEKDDTLRRKTLDLLYMMANAQNVAVVIEHMINALRTMPTTDDVSRKLSVNRIIEVSEWLLRTFVVTFEIARDLINEEILDNVFSIICKNSDDGKKDEEMRRCAVSEATKVLEKNSNDQSVDLLLLALRILGEFPDYCETPEEIMVKMGELLARKNAKREIQSQTIATLLKFVAKSKHCPENVLEAVNKCMQSPFCDVKQRCQEFIVLSNDFTLLDEIMKPVMEVDDLVVDESLSFLNDFVEDALKNGAKPYDPIPIVHEKPALAVEIRYEAYEKPPVDTRLSQIDRNVLPSGNLNSLPSSPTMTPGQLAWLGVTHSASSLSTHQEHPYSHNKQTYSFGNLHEHSLLLNNSQEYSYGEYDEHDAIMRQSTTSPRPKLALTTKFQNWSRSGYKVNQGSSKKSLNSPTLSSSTVDSDLKSPSSNVHPFLRTSNKAAPTTSVTTKTILSSEKERLASALFSGVGSSSVSGTFSPTLSGSHDNSSSYRKSLPLKHKHAVSDIHDLSFLQIHGNNVLNDLKPIQMTTQEFAGFWTKMTYERKEEVIGELAIDNMEVVKRRLENGLNDAFEADIGITGLHGKFCIVEVIGNEAIAASQYKNPLTPVTSFGMSNGKLVLLHFRLQPSLCAYAIRADLESIANSISKELKPYFMSYCMEENH